MISRDEAHLARRGSCGCSCPHFVLDRGNGRRAFGLAREGKNDNCGEQRNNTDCPSDFRRAGPSLTVGSRFGRPSLGWRYDFNGPVGFRWFGLVARYELRSILPVRNYDLNWVIRSRPAIVLRQTLPQLISLYPYDRVFLLIEVRGPPQRFHGN